MTNEILKTFRMRRMNNDGGEPYFTLGGENGLGKPVGIRVPTAMFLEQAETALEDQKKAVLESVHADVADFIQGLELAVDKVKRNCADFEKRLARNLGTSRRAALAHRDDQPLDDFDDDRIDKLVAQSDGSLEPAEGDSTEDDLDEIIV